jgi:hypothetical protein
MGLRTGRPNKLVWNPPELLDVLAGSISKKQLIEGFKDLPAGVQLDVLLRLDAASGAPDPRGNGGDHGRR